MPGEGSTVRFMINEAGLCARTHSEDAGHGVYWHHCLPDRIFARRPTNDACGFDGSIRRMETKSADAQAGVALAVIDERDRRNIMDFHTSAISETACSHVLRFTSLYDRGRAISVPCDEAGNVDIASLSLRLRNAYIAARAMVGREYSRPTVQRLAT